MLNPSASLLLLALACGAVEAGASWTHPKLDSCTLHPDLEARILKDVSIWADGGITEDIGLSICKDCDLRRRPAAEKPEDNCNRAQRLLIENGTVYLTNLVNTRHMSLDERIGFLVELYEASQVYQLPDVEVTHWWGDIPTSILGVGPDGASQWPHAPRGCMPPVMAWSKWNDCFVLLVPNSGHFRCVPDGFDNLEAHLEGIVSGVPWGKRLQVGFGRWSSFCAPYLKALHTADGQPMPCPRTHLTQLSEKHPQLLDIKDMGGGHEVPIQHQNRFRYLVSTDGWSVSCKLEKYLLLGSTVLKANSSVFGYFYDAIKPGVHYVPIMVNTSDDILQAVSWLRDHDGEARAIAAEGQRFALHHLGRSARLCYIFRLLQELSKKMGYKPTCRRRQLCVPLVHEIRFLAEHELTWASCRYQSVLTRYGATDQAAPAGAKAAKYAFKDLRRLHESGLLWPRDDLLKDLFPAPPRPEA